MNCLTLFQIYDGVFEPDTELAEFCGRDQPAVTIWSHSSVLYAHWSTDSHSSGQGFDAEYMHVHGELLEKFEH